MPVSSTSAPTIPDEMFLSTLKDYIYDSETETEGEMGIVISFKCKNTANLNWAKKAELKLYMYIVFFFVMNLYIHSVFLWWIGDWQENTSDYILISWDIYKK